VRAGGGEGGASSVDQKDGESPFGTGALPAREKKNDKLSHDRENRKKRRGIHQVLGGDQ